MTFTQEEFAQRHERVRAAMAEEGLDAVIAFSTSKVQANVRYLSRYYVRFSGMQTRPDSSYYMFGACACLFPLDGEPVVRTDQPWDVVRAKELSIILDTDGTTHIGRDLGPVVASRGYKRVGIDNWYLFPHEDFVGLQEASPSTQFVKTHLMSEVRRVKSPAEIEIIRKAEEVADAAVQAGMDAVLVGATEYEVALVAEHTMRERGETEIGGGSIISAGANTATGSSLPTREKVIQAGEWVLFDIVPRYEGYCGDIARMRLAGEESDLDPKLRKLYDVTVMMNEEVIKAIRPGVTPLELSKVAAHVADSEGVGEYRIDLLGHGVGLDIHDIPDYYFDRSPLRAGEVITVEPCLLVPGVAGTRVEDLVLVTETAAEQLSTTPKTLTPV